MAQLESRKVVLIGAGSAVFTRGLLADMIVDGGRWDVALVDIDPKALDVARGLASRMVAARGAPIRLSAHLDRREALDGADFVVTTIAVGGRHAWLQDVAIPRKYGIFQPVGDTIGPGGISRALRQIPAMVAIARDVARLAPRARLFNYANPMAANCRAVRKATGVPIVGLCHGVKGGERELAALLGVEPERCSFTAAGMNHLTFFVEARLDGEDAWPLIRRKLAECKPDPREYFRRELFRHTGAYSALADRHLCEFFPQFFRTGQHPGGRLGTELFSVEGTIEQGDRGYAAMAEQASGKAPLDESVFQRQVGEHEELVAIFRSLTRQAPKRYSVNVPNEGQVSNLPPEAVIECPAEVSTAGIVPVRLGRVPEFVRACVEKALLTVELAVDAALQRDRELFLEAIIADGHVPSMDGARGLADELWEANRPYLEGPAVR